MSTRTSAFDHAAIRNALYRTGLTTGEIAFRIDISAVVLQRIVGGADDPARSASPPLRGSPTSPAYPSGRC